MGDALDLGIGALRQELKSGGVGPSELVKASLQRAAAAGGLNAFTELRPQAAAEGETASGPLAGIPLAVKDVFVDRDRIPTCGSNAPGDWLTGTAAVVARLRDAGAVVVGYTNLHEWGVGTTSAITRTGPIRNPWDPGVVAGGSSGGSAVALGVGAAAAAIGTDAGGSIRVPSACCGVTGLKPTHGRVPMGGFVGEGGTIDHVGPLARSVEDAALLLAVMTAEDVVPEDPVSFRVGVPRSFFFDDVDPAVGAAVEAAVEVVDGLVADVRPVEVPSAATASFAVPALLLPLFARRLERVLAERPELLQPETRQVLELGRSATEGDVAEAERIRAAVKDDWRRVFEEVDVVVTPTIPAPPAPVETLVVELPAGPASAELAYLSWNAPMNLGGVPALSLPCGLIGSLTTSMTLTAAPGRDEAVLGLGRAFESATERAYADRIAPL